MSDRFVSGAVGESINRQELPVWWAEMGSPLRIYFPAANVARDILHGLTVIPDGFLVVTSDSRIGSIQLLQWTSTLAFLTSNVANSRATVMFYTLREVPVDA